MSDERFDKLKRQNRRILIAIAILLLTILVIGYMLLARANKNNTEYILPPLSALKGPKGDEGRAGYTPLFGIDYFNGRDGRDSNVPGPQGPIGVEGQPSTIPGPSGVPGRPPTHEEIAAAVADYCSANNNCQGPQGDPGPPGRTPEIRCNTQTGLWETRYEGDDAWTPKEGSDCNGPGN